MSTVECKNFLGPVHNVLEGVVMKKKASILLFMVKVNSKDQEDSSSIWYPLEDTSLYDQTRPLI